ncbi:dehydrogenase/reductase SDR family protein 7-like isoform X2 [Zootermopsis nevadensis]|uniref:dehydrogenase/reductase SDR family protein 7-like isoform X2 n=1 Tax=Zootermopsis nevadensis TaxID=136037 RepID=UPI000B8E9A17|nr:dehydrogenase/reductase SDR family protein 7-like isoform X2 [Zootermopsis nevadensis]
MIIIRRAGNVLHVCILISRHVTKQNVLVLLQKHHLAFPSDKTSIHFPCFSYRQRQLSKNKTAPTHPPVILTLDLSDLSSLPDHIKQALEIFGCIDILVHNGGISSRGDVLSTEVDVAVKVMMVNYFGQLALTKALLPSMIERQSGHIVAVSSVQGRIAIPYRSAYTASKHALQAFSDSLRAEVARYNIKVSVISPGYIATALSINSLSGSGEAHGEMDSEIANGYKPEYVADEILSAVVQGKKEVIISPITPWLAIIIRTFAPSLYFWIMERRAENTSH